MVSTNITKHTEMNTLDRSLLQRRNTLTKNFQSIYDGLVVILLVYVLTMAVDGVFTTPYMVMTLVLLGTMGLVYDRLSVYRHHGGMFQKAIMLGKAWSISFAILLTLSFLTKNTELYSRSVGIMLYLLGYLLQLLGHIVFRYVHSHQATVKALIIGTGPLADHIFERINRNPWMSEEVVGTVAIDSEFASEGEEVNNVAPNLGDLQSIQRLISANNIQTIYIAVPLDASPMIREIYIDLLNANLNIHWAPNIFNLNLINHSVKELSGIPILTFSESPLVGTRLLVKGILDRVLAMLALVLVSPIMLLTAIAIKLESPGPIFYRQARTGWDGKEFKIWKFRSMHVHEPADNVVKQATRDDPRVTRVGRFIRRTSIDELPQLFNVLTGNMSMVGPRPHAIQHNEQYSAQITAYLARHRIKPGITGLAQVRGFRGETKELTQMEKRVKCDLEYINSWSVWLDLGILIRTFFTLFSKNAY